MANPADKPTAPEQYERISQDREGKALRVTRQREDYDELCERNGWSIAARCRDNDRSASTKSKKLRPDYERMLRDIESSGACPTESEPLRLRS
jgi:DNA invertase Pin-like site-specific DNA recombinase